MMKKKRCGKKRKKHKTIANKQRNLVAMEAWNNYRAYIIETKHYSRKEKHVNKWGSEDD